MALTPMVDSTSELARPRALRERLDEHGYLFLRGVVDPATLDAALDDVLTIFERAGWLVGDRTDRRADADAFCVEPEPRFRAVYDRVFALESLHCVAHDPRLGAVLEGIIGGEVFAHPRKAARLTFPRSASADDYSTRAHQDHPTIQGDLATVSVWIPLHACALEDGPLAVLPGSHRNGVAPVTLGLGAGGLEALVDPDATWSASPLDQGDLIIFRSLTIHKALPNCSYCFRLSTDCRFQSYEGTVSERSLSLDDLGYDWEPVYASWAGAVPRYYWRERSPRAVPFDPRHERERDALAFELGARGDRRAISALQRIWQYGRSEAERDTAAHLLHELSAAPT